MSRAYGLVALAGFRGVCSVSPSDLGVSLRALTTKVEIGSAAPAGASSPRSPRASTAVEQPRLRKSRARAWVWGASAELRAPSGSALDAELLHPMSQGVGMET